MASIDQQFVEYIVKSLVGNPDAVSIERRIDEKGVLLELTVDPEDLGRVIGKRGATAQSIRSLLRALGTKNDARYNLKIVDNGVGGYNNNRSAPAANDDNANDNNISSGDKEEPTAKVEAKEQIELDDDEDEIKIDKSTSENVVSKTRKELEDLDDLDV